MQITEHADIRGAQRGIPQEIVRTIFEFGTQRQAPGRAVRILLDKLAISLAADGSTRRQSELERYRNAYLIVGEGGRVITIGRRTHRLFN